MQNCNTFGLVQKQLHIPIHLLHVSANKYFRDKEKEENENLPPVPFGSYLKVL